MLDDNSFDRDCDTPSFDEQAGNMPSFFFGQNDREELDTWIDGHNRPMSDAEADADYEREMIRRDAQRAALAQG